MALHSLGIAKLSPEVMAQLAAKHPERQRSIPQVLPGDRPRALTVHLEESFRKLRKRCGTGVSGMRNEYMRCLVGRFDDQHANRVMESYNEFATAAVNVELPLWFYSAWAIMGVSPLVKAAHARAGGGGSHTRWRTARQICVRSGPVTDGAVKAHVRSSPHRSP